jgi:hypothetical protein
MEGYLPRAGDMVTLSDIRATVYTVIKMQEYYDHDPMSSEVLLLRPDGKTTGWDTLATITLWKERGNVEGVYRYLNNQI